MLNKLYAHYLLATNVPRLFELVQTRQWCRQMFAEWIGNLEVQKGDIVADVGCGPGGLSQSFAKLGCKTTGVDQSEAMLNFARNTNNPALDNLEFKFGDVLDLPFCDNQFDYVVAGSLINIISDPNKALQELVRSVKPGGKVSYLVPHSEMSLLNAQKYCQVNNINGLAASLLELWANKAIGFAPDAAIRLSQKASLKNAVVHQFLDNMAISVTAVKQFTNLPEG